MRGWRRAGTLLLILLAAPGGAAAGQQRTASLEVRFRDAAGRPSAGVTIAAEREDGFGRYACVTRDDGRCVMLAVAPGAYRVFAQSSHGGDAPALVDLAPGDYTRLELPPPARPGAQRGPGAIAVAGDTPSVRLGRDELAYLPAGRALLDALRVNPWQPSTGDWRLDPAPPAETHVFLDGIEWPAKTAGLERGRRADPGVAPRSDGLDAVRFDRTAGATASAARGTAGSITAVLRSGGARLDAEASLAYEGSPLDGSPRPFSRYSPWDTDLVERRLTVPATPWASLAPAVSVGGPLGLPGFSFHASGSHSRRTRHRDAVFLDDPERLTRHFSWGSWSGQGTLNLTAAGRAGRRARLAAVFGRSRNRGGAPGLEPDQGRLPDGGSTAGFTRAPFLGPVETLARWHDTGTDSRRIVVSPAVDWPLGPTWSLSADASLSASNSWTPPAFRGVDIRRIFANSNAKVPGLTPDAVHPAGYADHRASYGTVRDQSRRIQLNLETRWAPGRRASHLVSAGLRADRLADAVYIGHERPVIRLHWRQAYQTEDGRLVTGRYGYYTVSRPGTIGEATGATLAVWLQDRWSPIDRLTIEAGVRAEREAPPSYVPHVDGRTPFFGFGDKLAPRVSLAWQPDEAGSWRLQASFGRYFDHLTTNLARALFGARHDVRESWTLDSPDWRTLACDEGRRDCPGQFIERVDANPPWNTADPALSSWLGPTTRINPGLRPMQTAEWGAAVERRLAGRTSLAVRYTGKRLERAVEDVGLTLPGGAHTLVLANPGWGYASRVVSDRPAFPQPRATRRYRELEVEVRRRGRRVALAARYRWGRLTGNYGGLAAADEGGRESTNLTGAFDAVYSGYDRWGRPVDGPLPGDRPHRLGVDATLVLPRGTTLTLAGLLESGRPESSHITFHGATVPFNGYGDLGRHPAFSQLDLQLRQDVHLGRRILSLEATFDNVFDQEASLAYFSTNRYRDDLGLPEATFFQVPWDPVEWVERLRAEGVRVRDEQLFLVPDQFQRARRVTLAARLRF